MIYLSVSANPQTFISLEMRPETLPKPILKMDNSFGYLKLLVEARINQKLSKIFSLPIRFYKCVLSEMFCTPSALSINFFQNNAAQPFVEQLLGSFDSA